MSSQMILDNGNDGVERPNKMQRMLESVDNEEEGRRKLELAGFDPDNVNRAELIPSTKPSGVGSWENINAMTHFSYYGDLAMCRYLFSRGADVSKSFTSEFWFPLYAAASQGYSDVCKWLVDNGADIREETDFSKGGHSPLSNVASKYIQDDSYEELFRWLVLNGALQSDSGEINRNMLWKICVDQPRILDRLRLWANTSIQINECFKTFLMGTLSLPHDSSHINSRYKTRSYSRSMLRFKSPVQCFSGNAGILEQISDYVGIVRSEKGLHVLRLIAAIPDDYCATNGLDDDSSQSD